ncbi:hypothetical protein [Kistimonas asteriae]|uniref:hypothetical protein n=1 Tax=Kistimonas asteriae TaxID=517724 RepID=UPI001BAB50C8|nr:hypothetical protein [Kistimonas asteriae]
MIICFLGPDGSGKTTITNSVVDKVKCEFNGCQRYHLRTYFGLKKKTVFTVTDPHGQKPRGWLVSNIKLIYFLLDYCFGFTFLLKKENLIIFDRFYHDLLVDPKRYRFGGSFHFAKFLSKFVPEPDIYFVLVADPSLIQKRKKEVPLNETERQVQLYKAFAENNKKAFLIDTGNEVNQSVDNVIEIILKRLE